MNLDSYFERSFYNVKMFNTYAPTNRFEDTKDSYILHENLKRLKYQDRIVDNENESFSPLIFATTVGASPITQKFIRRTASLIVQKSNERYPELINFIRTRVSFSLLKICGYRG